MYVLIILLSFCLLDFGMRRRGDALPKNTFRLTGAVLMAVLWVVDLVRVHGPLADGSYLRLPCMGGLPDEEGVPCWEAGQLLAGL